MALLFDHTQTGLSEHFFETPTQMSLIPPFEGVFRFLPLQTGFLSKNLDFSKPERIFWQTCFSLAKSFTPPHAMCYALFGGF